MREGGARSREFFFQRAPAPRVSNVAHHGCGLWEKLAEPVTRKISRALFSSDGEGLSGGKVAAAAAARGCGVAIDSFFCDSERVGTFLCSRDAFLSDA